MSSTFFVSPRLLADAICEAECFDFSQLTLLAASLARVHEPSRSLRRRLATALAEIVARQECVARKAYAWQPHSDWRVLFCSETKRRMLAESGVQFQPDRLLYLGQQIAKDLVDDWDATACSLPIDIYFEKHSADRFELSGLHARRISARLILSEYWLRLNRAVFAMRPELPRRGFLSLREASLHIRVPPVLPDSQVLAETAVFHDRDKLIAVFAFVPLAGERDATAIEHFFSEALCRCLTTSNEFVIVGPDMSRRKRYNVL